MSDLENEPIGSIANEYRDGDQIYHVEGTLTKLYQAKRNTHGSLQNGELTDSNGDTIKITFADCEQNMSARNQYIVLECVESTGHGWTGVKVKDDAQYGRAIWVTPSASVRYPSANVPPAGGAPAPQQGNRPPPRRQGPPARQPQQGPRQPNSAPRTTGAPATTAQRTQPTGGGDNQFEGVARFVNCYLYCFDLVNEKLNPKLPDPSDEFSISARMDAVQRACATIFVDVAKSGIAGKWNPELKPRRFPKPPTDPKEWKLCYIEKEGSALDGKTIADISDEDLRKLHSFYDEKQSNHSLAECVYQAAIDRKVFSQTAPAPEPDQEYADDDIPF